MREYNRPDVTSECLQWNGSLYRRTDSILSEMNIFISLIRERITEDDDRFTSSLAKGTMSNEHIYYNEVLSLNFIMHLLDEELLFGVDIMEGDGALTAAILSLNEKRNTLRWKTGKLIPHKHWTMLRVGVQPLRYWTEKMRRIGEGMEPFAVLVINRLTESDTMATKTSGDVNIFIRTILGTSRVSLVVSMKAAS